MKCNALKLCNRSDVTKKLYHVLPPPNSIEFITQEYHSFTFQFLRNKKLEPKAKPRVKITNLRPDKDFPSFKNGTSLEKWSKKTPRLRSSRRSSNITESNTEDYDISFDFSVLFQEAEEQDEGEDQDNDSTSYFEYEIHSDIEDLINRTQAESVNYEKKHKRRKKGEDDKAKRKIKKKLKKKIKFSLSKPPSPETEQVIRVDVTSNICIEDYENMEKGLKKECKRGHEPMINESRKELSGRFKGNEGLRLNKEDEDFIILCRQLVISPKDKLTDHFS